MPQQSLPKPEQTSQAMHQILTNPTISNTENSQCNQEFQPDAIPYDIQSDSSQPSKLFESLSQHFPFRVSQKQISATSFGRLERLMPPSAFHSKYVLPKKNLAELGTEYKRENSFGIINNAASRTIEKNTYGNKNVFKDQVFEVPENRPVSWKEKYVSFTSFCSFINIIRFNTFSISFSTHEIVFVVLVPR